MKFDLDPMTWSPAVRRIAVFYLLLIVGGFLLMAIAILAIEAIRF